MKNKQPIGNKIKSLLLMEVSWHMWKTDKHYLHIKTILRILHRLCTAKEIAVTEKDMAHVINNSKCYRKDEEDHVYFASSHLMAFFLAKRLYLTLRKVKMKALYKLLNTRCYDNDILYFLSMLDQDTNSICAPLQSILRDEYMENVTENALHIYCTTAQFKKGFQTQRAGNDPGITHYNLTQNLDFSLEVKNNTFNSNNVSMAKSFFDKGLQLLKENKNFEALEPFFAAKALDPDCNKAANNLAIAFKNLGSISIARQMAQRVLLEDPHNHRAKQHLKYLDNEQE
jgi:tetratricopeptide (TPR) repeat protein